MSDAIPKAAQQLSETHDPELLWSPSDPSTAQTTLFLQRVNERYNLSLGSYEELWQWSIDHRGDFWSEVWDYHNVVGTKGQAPFVDASASPAANPRWFDDAKLNWAENQLKWYHECPDEVAVIQMSETCPGHTPERRNVTWRELYRLVGKAQRAMKKEGVVKGDRIAFWGGTCLESVVTLLACSSLGAIFSSAAADFGVDGVLERLTQIRPKLLIVTNAVVYAETPRPLLPLLPKLLPALQHPPAKVVTIDHLPKDMVPGVEKSSVCPTESWEEFLALGGDEGETTFERIGFNEPIWILFSSGTTGKPKAIVHRQGGMLLDSLREHHLAGDIGRGSVFFYYTTPFVIPAQGALTSRGWMMYQYLVSGLATGATIVLFEGSPLKRPEILWNMVDDLCITAFGASAKYIEQLSKHYPDISKKHSLKSLKQIMSTGSPLPPQLFDFVYSNIKKDVLLGSVTGGTDICSVFAGRTTSLPVYRGEIQCRMLGFALDTVGAAPGVPGELICRKAFPIEPLGFWPLPGHGFPEDAVKVAQDRFKESYFKDDEGLWYHGDFVQITKSRSGNGGGMVMLGRSDGVLNPGGIRFGPTDIYSVLENPTFTAAGIDDTLVVGLMVEGGADEKVILFVKMSPNVELDDALIKKMRTAIRLARSARHVPSKILVVQDIPVTLTGKRVEVPIRKVINGAPVSSINPATLRNPECLEEYAVLGAKMRKEEGM